jgi:hypothetical protein
MAGGGAYGQIVTEITNSEVTGWQRQEMRAVGRRAGCILVRRSMTMIFVIAAAMITNAAFEIYFPGRRALRLPDICKIFD